tara:strand:+ start:114 stop:404 length:291 start_codon:yes stop_codon:yes gene_type:complete
MKKIFKISFLIFFIYFNPTQVKFSHAISLSGITDIFKDPLELCMDRVIAIEGKYETSYAARVCAGSNKGTKKCMDRIIAQEGKYEVGYAARVCNGN